MQPTAKFELAASITRKVIDDWREAAAIEALISRLNDDASLRRLFDQTYEGHGVNIIRTSLLRHLVVVLARLYDPSSPSQNRGKDRASIRHLMHLLADKDVIREAVALARDWLPDEHRLEEANARVAHRSLQLARVRFHRLSNHEPGRTWLKELKKFRDRYIAHSLFGMQDETKLLYGYLGEILSATTKMIGPLRFAIQGTAWEPDDSIEEEGQKADAFWSVVAIGMSNRD